jgi:hypothetical protein
MDALEPLPNLEIASADILRQNVRQPVIRRVAPAHTDIEDVLFPHWPF